MDNMQSTIQGIVVNLQPDVIEKVLRETGRLVDQMTGIISSRSR